MTGKRKADALASQSKQPRVLHVHADDGELEDAELVCAGGDKVVTTSFLLGLLSPTVLRGAVEAARQHAAGASEGSSAGSTRRLKIPCHDDSADTWLLCLRLRHPALFNPAPEPSWVDLSSMVKLADKYAIVPVLQASVGMMEQVMRNNNGGTPFNDMNLLWDGIKLARHLNLKELENLCWEAAERLVTHKASPYGPSLNTVTIESGARIAVRLAAKYMLRHKLPSGNKTARSSSKGGDEDASMVITLLMTRLAALDPECWLPVTWPSLAGARAGLGLLRDRAVGPE